MHEAVQVVQQSCDNKMMHAHNCAGALNASDNHIQSTNSHSFYFNLMLHVHILTPIEGLTSKACMLT